MKAAVQLYLGQEPLGVCGGCRRRRIGCVAVEHQLGGVEQELFRGCARVHGEELKPGALIEIKSNVHMLNVSVPRGAFNRTVVTVCGDFSEVEHVAAAPIGNTAGGPHPERRPENVCRITRSGPPRRAADSSTGGIQEWHRQWQLLWR